MEDRALQGWNSSATASPEWEAASQPPHSYTTPPSKDACFFVQPMGSTSVPVDPAAGSRTVPLASAAETVSPNHRRWAVVAHRLATRRRRRRVLPEAVPTSPPTLAWPRLLQREAKAQGLPRVEPRGTLELSRVLVPILRHLKTHHSLPPHAPAVPVSQHPWNRSGMPLRPRLRVPVFNSPRQPTELRPLARM